MTLPKPKIFLTGKTGHANIKLALLEWLVQNSREDANIPCVPREGGLSFITGIPINCCCQQDSSWLSVNALLGDFGHFINIVNSLSITDCSS